jgi:hypothetical protein
LSALTRFLLPLGLLVKVGDARSLGPLDGVVSLDVVPLDAQQGERGEPNANGSGTENPPASRDEAT